VGLEATACGCLSIGEEATMLGNKDAIATIAVRDLGSARKFYEGTLGLKAVDTQGSETITFKSGGSTVIVYRSQYAGTNKATVVNWIVDDIDKIVVGLKERGVKFEHYDLPGLTQKGDVHAFGDFMTAWFKDLDGNILALMSG
jgi:catechol 2,3-dioxygenase-like lactoylglutathione lyase family enzyme